MKQKLIGIGALLLGTVVWGGAFPAQRAGMALLGPFTFQAVRCALAVLALAAVIFLLDRKNFLKKWRDKKLWTAGLFCGLALFVSVSLQQVGLVHTDAGKAGFLTAMYIVLVPVLGLFLGRRPGPWAWVAVAVAVAGMYLLCGAGVSGINIGDLLILGCALSFSVQITLIDRLAGGVDSLRLNCIQALVVTVLTLPLLLTEEISLKSIGASWFSLSYAGILSMGLGYWLQLVGQKRVEPTAASMVMSLEAVFAVITGVLFLQETMSAYEITGCVLVFAAVFLAQLPGKKPEGKRQNA